MFVPCVCLLASKSLGSSGLYITSRKLKASFILCIVYTCFTLSSQGCEGVKVGVALVPCGTTKLHGSFVSQQMVLLTLPLIWSQRELIYLLWQRLRKILSDPWAWQFLSRQKNWQVQRLNHQWRKQTPSLHISITMTTINHDNVHSWFCRTHRELWSIKMLCNWLHGHALHKQLVAYILHCCYSNN